MTSFRSFPLLLMLALLAAMVAVDQLFPAQRMSVPWVRWLGAPMLIMGVVILLVSADLFRRRHTTLHPYGEPDVLVQDGLYRYSRNPMYVGMLLILAGAGVVLAQPLSLLWLTAFVVVVSYQNIRHEERFLEARFGNGYRQYCARVRRWI